LLDGLLRAASAAGATVVVASHELERATPLAHRVVHLAGGRTVVPPPVAAPPAVSSIGAAC